MEKGEHSLSLQRKCFENSKLNQADLHSASPDQDCSTNHDDVQAPTLTVEDVDSKMSPTLLRRKLNGPAGDICLHLDLRHRHRTLHGSMSGSSVDSGLGPSRTNSSSSLPHSNRSSREGPNIADFTASPLVESRRLVSVDKLGQEMTAAETDNLIGEEQRKGDTIIASSSRILDSEELISTTPTDEDDLTARTKRLTISREALDNLFVAAQELFHDVHHQQMQAQGIALKKTSFGGSALTLPTERDGPCHVNVRRHSSADPYIPLTQRQSRQLERKRSAQPSFHRSPSLSFAGEIKDEDSGSSNCKVRKNSACIVCERKRRKQSSSMPSVIIRTAMTPDHQKKRRYSEILKVYKPSEIPFTELRLMKIEELSERVQNGRGMDRGNHKPLSSKHAVPLPDSTTPSSRSEVMKPPNMVKDEQLKVILENNMPQFLKFTDWNGLFAYLVSKGLLNSESRDILLCPLRTTTEKGNFFYGKVLPKMGHEIEAYVKLYQCLNETKVNHPGHATLFKLLDKSLKNYYYDQYCHVTTSTVV